MRTLDPEPEDTPQAARDGNRVQSVDRAVLLLRAIAASAHPPTAWELARTCGINRSTAWRLLQTLEHHGLVQRDGATQRYGIGYTALEVAAAAGYDGLARRARPILQRVAKDAGESVMLAAARTFSLVYVDQVDPPTIPTPNWLGRNLPLHATSAGKVFLAWLPEAERDARPAVGARALHRPHRHRPGAPVRVARGGAPRRLRGVPGRVRGVLERRLRRGARPPRAARPSS